ncbi:hypothetical protein OOU_Y34scaffold00770g4 [Pyricularia oryzae Y34]|uniref:Uncharacterized protein n=2 Tax=Pyricularia oryzae TaxID=318829 RepID=A0AA97NQ86_PYRO3|nr:hypothetical protein OOU_Y34scaffold00770g4 [Pyricularia oryzae Y34]
MRDHDVNTSGALSTSQSSTNLVDGRLTVGALSEMDIDNASSWSLLDPSSEQAADCSRARDLKRQKVTGHGAIGEKPDECKSDKKHLEPEHETTEQLPIGLAAASDDANVPEIVAYESSNYSDQDEEDLSDTSDALDEDEEDTLESEHLANLQRILSPSVPAIVFTPPSPKRTSPRSPVSTDEEAMPDDPNSLDPGWVCREKLDDMMEKDRKEEKRRRERKRRGAIVSEKELRRQIRELEATLEEVGEEKRQLKQKNYRQERQLRQLKTTPLAKQALQTLADVAAMEKKARARTQAVADMTFRQAQYLDLIDPEQHMLQIYPEQPSQSYKSKITNAKATRESTGENRAVKRNSRFSAAHGDDRTLHKPVQAIGAHLHAPDKTSQLEAKLEQNAKERLLLKAELAAVNSRFKAFLSGEELASKMLPHVLEELKQERNNRMNFSTEVVYLRAKLSRLRRGNAGESTPALTGRQPDNTDETL